jgi:hypothetical protein
MATASSAPGQERGQVAVEATSGRATATPAVAEQAREREVVQPPRSYASSGHGADEPLTTISEHCPTLFGV